MCGVTSCIALWSRCGIEEENLYFPRVLVHQASPSLALYLALFRGLPHFFFLFFGLCSGPLLLPYIILNANRKTGEAWERGHISSCRKVRGQALVVIVQSLFNLPRCCYSGQQLMTITSAKPSLTFLEDERQSGLIDYTCPGYKHTVLECIVLINRS